MPFKLDVIASNAVIDDFTDQVSGSEGLEILPAADPEGTIVSPLSLLEAVTLTLAVYATTFEPLLPLLRRALTREEMLVLRTRYGTVTIRPDAPLSDEQLVAMLRPLLPKQ